MKLVPTFAAVLLLAAGAPALLFTGCASRGYTRAATTSTTMADASTEVEAARRQVDESVSSLSTLMTAPPAELRTSFERYQNSVQGLERSVTQIKEKAQQMETQGRKYFESWEKQQATMHNEDIRARSEDRQREVSDQLTRVQQQYMEARRDIDPLLVNLKDVQKLLSADLTPAGVESAREFIPRIENASEPARQALARLGEELRSASASLSSTASPTPTK